MRLRLCIPLAVLVVCFGVFVGCAQVKRSIDDYAYCRGNAECLQQMQATQASVHSIVSNLPVSNPLGNALGVVATALAGIVSGVIYGRKLRKKKEE